MADSDLNPTVFSLRIVSLDYNMKPPIAGLDISYSNFHGGRVNEVPVIRIYGSTPAGQKTCLHVHRVLPYLYFPCSDLGLFSEDQAESHMHALSRSLENALKLKGNAGSKRQHVHACCLVRGKKFYGYHTSEEAFVKIFFYNPQDVSRAANLLLAGAVFDKALQPYESHIPYLLQFLIDYNLYGMGHLHLSKMMFRYPIPDVFLPHKTKHNAEQRSLVGDSVCMNADVQADTGGNTNLKWPIWTSSTIPDGWIWRYPLYQDSSANDDIQLFDRESTCELEGDALVDDILNQHFVSHVPLSEAHSEVKMVQSLIPIWEEEVERNGVPDAIPPDRGKPLPQNVLKTLSNEVEYGKLIEVVNDGEIYLTTKSTQSSKESGDLVITGVINVESTKHLKKFDRNRSISSLNSSFRNVVAAEMHDIDAVDQQELRGTAVTSSAKASDEDALHLLKWLASSQAADDINSDDELTRETILSPLLPARNIDKMLEKASTDYETESQQECRDILDSVDALDFKELDGEESNADEDIHPFPAESNKIIHLFDGSNDDLQSVSCADKLKKADSSEAMPSLAACSLSEFDSSSICKHGKKRPRWGYLPISNPKVNDASYPRFSISDESNDEKHEGVGTSSFENEAKGLPYSLKGKDVSMDRTSSLVECSTRNLMRRKRSHQIEFPKHKCSFEDQKAVLCSDVGCGRGCSCTYTTVKIDLGDKKPFLPMHKPPIFNEGAKCHEAIINSTLVVGMESNHDETIRSDHNIPRSSIKDSIMVGNTPEKENQEFVVQLNHDVSSDREIPHGCRHHDSSRDVSFEPMTNIGCPYGSGFRGPNFTSKVTDLPAEDMKDNQSIIAFHHFDKPPACERSSGISERVDSTSENVKDGEPVNLIGMTFSMKPPILEWVDEPRHGVLPVSGNVDCYGGPSNVCLPFFTMNCLEETDREQADLGQCRVSNNQESAVGIPVLYQSDGSYLFLLTFSVSSPSRECVDKWLLENDAASSLRVMSLECSGEIADSEGSEVNSITTFPEHVIASSGKTNLHQPYQHNPESFSMRNHHKTRRNPPTGCLNDVSQISGPDRRTLTPLSQIGFRDPASVGGGQQLTLLSIEVHTESRGELRPDPRFDAINAIVLVFQEDDESQDAQVLLRTDSITMRPDLDAVSECVVRVFTEELDLFNHFSEVIHTSDPDVIMGWDVQSGSLGFLAERAVHLGLGLLNDISRTPLKANVASGASEGMFKERLSESGPAEAVFNDTIIEDEWGRTHASGVHVGGRIVLNMWRLMRNEVKLNMYTVEAVAEAVLRRKVPSIPWRVLAKWFASGPGCARYRCLNYILERARLNLQIMDQLDMINRTSELARVFGIDFFSVLSRGSQYRVESMFLRLAHTQNFLAISPTNRQVANQPAMECLPLVMEPESGFYGDPVIVLDFQSLYPSMVIAYNLCYCTCLGKFEPQKKDILGVTSYSADINIFHNLKDELLATPNGVAYVPSNVRRGILPRLLEEILSTRIMVKQAMKKLAPSELVLHRIFNARQLALKLIANVTYGYTAAGFSGRMPCAELADSIVQCGRRTLETAISFVNSNNKWKARVIYGDTDSMFVLLKGRSLREAFTVGREIASAITEINPDPVTLKMEKVYYPCFLLTKKRYVGYSYESPDQIKPVFDAKGVETVRRDTCKAVSKIMEQSLRMYLEDQNMNKVKEYTQRQWIKILSGRVSLQDFVFAKEVRLGTYSSRASSLPPAAIVATKAMRDDPRAEPRDAERIPYVVVHGEPGARLVDMVVDPLELLAINSPFRLNDIYYIRKQIIPALQRIFGFLGADLNKWFLGMPRPERESVGKHHNLVPNLQRTRIDYYYLSKHCILCGDLVQASDILCHICSKNESRVATALVGRTAKLEKDIQHLGAMCRHCGGGDWHVEGGVKCISLACSVFYERRKVQKELLSLSEVCTQNNLYPKCTVEWF